LFLQAGKTSPPVEPILLRVANAASGPERVSALAVWTGNYYTPAGAGLTTRL